MFKNLIIFIPCYNEENCLPITLEAIPKKIKNITNIEVVIVDDASTDGTIEVAKNLKVQTIISHQYHIGLSKIFSHMVDYFIKSDFDLMCVLDADNQYDANDIEKLIKKMIETNCDLVVGGRNILKNKNMNLSKKIFQVLGTKIINFLTKQQLHDVTSGFRIYNKKCFSEYFYLENRFTYSIESLILFSWKKIKVESVLINTNEKILRGSRLFNSNIEYIKRQVAVIFDSLNKFYPFRFFSFISILLLIPGFLISLRFLYFFFVGSGGHVQSLILASILMIASFLTFSMAILLGSLSKIRINMEKNFEQKRNLDYKVLKF